MKHFLYICLSAIVLVASGCASVERAKPELDAAAKKFAVAPGKANIYLFRDEIFGGAIRMPVTLDGVLVGATGPKTYMALDVSPGAHKLVSQAENESVLELTTDPGRNYYVWQEVKMGLWTARSQLQQVDEVRGKEGVMKSELLERKDSKGGVSVSPIAAPASTAQPDAAAPTQSGDDSQPAQTATPLVPVPKIKGGVLAYEAENAAKNAGCQTTSGNRPAAIPVEIAVGREVYEVQCSQQRMTVQCERACLVVP